MDTYTVPPGVGGWFQHAEALTRARRYVISMHALQAANADLFRQRGNNLQVGDVLNVPDPPTQPAQPAPPPPIYFVKPSWSSSFVGATSAANGVLLRQELNLGGHTNVALIGVTSWRNVRLTVSDPIVASLELEDPVSANQGGNLRLAFQIVGKQRGEPELSLFVDDKPIASMQISVSNTPAADAIYVDRFIAVYYDLGYRRVGKDVSKFLILKYVDDVVIDLNIDRITDGFIDNDQGARMVAAAVIEDGGKTFPQMLNRTTTPRLFAAKQAAIEAMSADLLGVVDAGEFVVEFILGAVQVAQLSARLSAIRTSRASLPPPVRQMIGKPPLRVTPEEVQEALDAARKEHSITTLYHGGQRDIPPGRPFSTTDSLEHAQQYARRNGGQIYRYEVPTSRLKQLESADQPGVQRMVDSLQGTSTNATEYRFSPQFLQNGGLEELIKYRQPLPVVP